MDHPRAAARALVVLALLCLPSVAHGTGTPPVRYAAVDGAGDACTVAAPCALSTAVSGAVSGGEIVVQPGTYRVDAELELEQPANLHGAAGKPRPWLVGSGTVDDAVLTAKRGGTLRHLGLKSTAADGQALEIQGAVAEDILAVAEHGDAVKITGGTTDTVLRDSVVYVSANEATAARLRDIPPAGGDTYLVNVTAMAPQGRAVRCDMRNGHGALVNTIARGGEDDVDASGATAGHCSASTSNFRAAGSTGVADGGGNQEGQPLFADAGTADYRVLDGTPTNDAGATDARLGAADPAGCPRTLGPAPDIGAYEVADPVADACASAAAEPLLLAPALPDPPVTAVTPVPVVTSPGDDDSSSHQEAPRPPKLGHSVVAEPSHGKLRVRVPGSRHFRALTAGARIPVGSVIDARAGRVRLTSALDRAGRVQTATFWGAKFEVRQRRSGHGMVDLYLRGGGLSTCPQAAAAHAGASIAAKRHKRVRSLWGRDRHGRYRTHGQNSAATARGTRWLTRDTCAGTRTRVLEGAVAVRDHVRHRTVLVRAGHSYLARAAG